MDDSDENSRTIAVCMECGSLYAALEITDDTFRPIGRRDGCECGSTEFTPVDRDVSGISLEDDSTGRHGHGGDCDGSPPRRGEGTD